MKKQQSKTRAPNQLLIFPDGPIGHDGNLFVNSRGELNYLESLCDAFDEIIIVTYVLRVGDPSYEQVCDKPIKNKKIRIKELRSEFSKSFLAKSLNHVINFFLIGKILLKTRLLFLFLPSYPSVSAAVFARIYRIPYFIYAADDWNTSSESIIKRSLDVSPSFQKALDGLSVLFENFVIRKSKFAVVAGGELKEKYSHTIDTVELTVPRMTLTKDKVITREDYAIKAPFRLINVAALIPDKDHVTLLRAFKFLVDQKSVDAELTLVGDGASGSALKDLCRKLNISDRVVFHGYESDETKIYELLKQSDCFVLSSINEGFPRVIYEALSQGLPIVSTNVGGVPVDMTHNVNCLISEKKDVPALAENMFKVFNNDGLRERLVIDGQNFLKTRLGNNAGEQIQRLIKSTI